MIAVRAPGWSPSLARLRGGRRHAPRRAWLADVAPRLAAVAVAAGSAGTWHTERVSRTSTSLAVAVVRCDATMRRCVVKVPGTAESAHSLRRQAKVLASLHADPRLTDWCPVVPRCLGQGEIDGRPYWVEEALPGRPVTAVAMRRGTRRALLDTAVGLIEDLHARTAGPTRVDSATLDAWVGRPLGRIAAHCASRARGQGLLQAVDRLRDQLTAALADRCVRTCVIHGDFWTGNLLRSGSSVTGIVDWDQATAPQLPLHDLLHVHVLSRRLATGMELGEVVARAATHGIGDALGVPPDRVAAWRDGVPERSAVLLYWLRHVSLFIDSEGHRDNPRWLRGNVDRVLAHA
jgi:aminoglycoside phosphotransferase (APT) family kinase protein